MRSPLPTFDMTTTQTGRVVYDRPRHFFGPRDLLRISRSLLPPESLSSALLLLGVAAEILMAVFDSMLSLFGQESYLSAVLSFWKNLVLTLLNGVLRISMPPDTRKILTQIQRLLLSL